MDLPCSVGIGFCAFFTLEVVDSLLLDGGGFTRVTMERSLLRVQEFTLAKN
ncbi:hypothetical protein QG37_06984 [Candidozyma auris]|nr:hypothetical protein QG37_06984 [[Candida] auris]